MSYFNSRRRKYVNGGTIGSTLGGLLGTAIGGPLGTKIGSAAGGLIGGQFGKKNKTLAAPTPVITSTAFQGYAMGGAMPLGKGAVKYKGPKHEKGGILIDENGMPTDNEEMAIAEVEGGETRDENYIFSDTLTVPGVEMTFADAHEELVRQGASKEWVEELKMMQEQVRQESGIADQEKGIDKDYQFTERERNIERINSPRRDDSLLENMIEFVDPTGISSWDDAERAYYSMRRRSSNTPNADEALDMVGALPLVGKFGKSINLAKGAAKLAGDARNASASIYNALKKGSDSLNRLDAVEDETGFLNQEQKQTMKNGGPTDPPNFFKKSLYTAQPFSTGQRTFENTQSQRLKEQKIFDATRDREARIQESIDVRNPQSESYIPFLGPRWRDRLATETQAIGDKFRVSNKPNFFDDYVNPFSFIGGMASGVGSIPKDIKSGNYGSVAYNIGVPLVTGGLGGIGAKTTTQFINNLLNPATAVTSNLKNSNLARQVAPTVAAIKDHALGLKYGFMYPSRYAITPSKKAKLLKDQDEAFKKALDFTEEWFFDKEGNIHSAVLRRMRDLVEDGTTLKALREYNRHDDLLNPMKKPNKLVSSRRKDLKMADISDADKSHIERHRSEIGGVNTSDNSITIRNIGNYYKSPRIIAGTATHEGAHTIQKLGRQRYYPDSPLRLSPSWGDQISKWSHKLGFRTANPSTFAGRDFAEYMVDPDPRSYWSIWRSAPSELHSDLSKARYNFIEDATKNKSKEFRDELIDQLRSDPSDQQIDNLIDNYGLNKFFKSSASREDKRRLIRMLPAVTPPSLGYGVYRYNQEEDTKPQIQMFGGNFKYKNSR